MFIVILIVLFSIYCAYKSQIDYMNRNLKPEPKRERVVIVYPQIFTNQDEDVNFQNLVNQDKNIMTNRATSNSKVLDKNNKKSDHEQPCPCCSFPW